VRILLPLEPMPRNDRELPMLRMRPLLPTLKTDAKLPTLRREAALATLSALAQLKTDNRLWALRMLIPHDDASRPSLDKIGVCRFQRRAVSAIAAVPTPTPATAAAQSVVLRSLTSVLGAEFEDSATLPPG
jgi:hypothetical protein